MTIEYTWCETTEDVYRALYKQHASQLKVFESFTDMGPTGDKLEAQITAWGFKDAKHPIIKSELSRSHGWQYYILRTAYEAD